jgi:ankyrin repeat protein
MMESVHKQMILTRWVELDKDIRRYVDNDTPIDNPNSDGLTLLHRAARLGHCEAIDYLLEKGADLNSKTPVIHSTPLHRAVISGCLATVSRIVEGGADINAVDCHGTSALHDAVTEGSHEIVSLLLDKGASRDIHNKYGQTPISLSRHQCITDLLLTHSQ